MSLTDLHARLCQVYESIQSFDVPFPQPPVIDFSLLHEGDNKQALPGLRYLREEVKRDCEVLDNFLREHANPSALSTNAPYLIAVWDELVHARRLVAIYRVFSLAGGQDDARKQRKTPKGRRAIKTQTRTVKVDVVAENGARWVRVNTIKNARLMMEFHEMDSYLTSDEDEDGLRQPEFDNSVLRMGKDLLAAAKANPVSAPSSRLHPDSNSTTPNPDHTIIPQVTICLTRLDPPEGDTSDPRIERTIQCLRDMSIDVQLGERSYLHSAPIRATPPKLKLLEPTTNVNLDLSALIALISDISHSPLPRTEEEAHARFVPPQSYLDWKKDRAKSLAHQSQTTDPFLHDLEDGEDDDGDTWENSEQHSRALAAQAVQEMNRGILEEIHERLSAVVGHPSVLSPSATFWTTNEARHRCLQIVSKIGGEKERQRADALLGSMLYAHTPPVPAPALRLNGSPRAGGIPETTPEIHDMEGKTAADIYWVHSRYPARFLPLAPVHIYPSILPGVGNEDRPTRTSFFDVLTQTCTGILLHEPDDPMSQVLAPSDPLPTVEEILEEFPPATQTSLPKLTVHTVRSLLAGASRGYTTLTTNRSSVKAMLKEARRVCGRGGYEPGMGDVEKAALWILDPRSLSEGMRSK